MPTPTPAPLASAGRRVRESPQQQGGRARARVKVPRAALPEVGRPALPGDQRNGRFRALLRGVCRCREHAEEVGARVEGALRRVHRRRDRVHHGLVTDHGFSARYNALQPGSQRGDRVGRGQFLLGAECGGRPQAGRAVQRTGRAADGGNQRGGKEFQHSAGCCRVRGVDRGDECLEAAAHVLAVVAVADHPIQLDQFVAVLRDHVRGGADGADHRARVAAHHRPQRRAAVCTGASHSSTRRSSSLSRVRLMPCISRLVMYGPTSRRVTVMPRSASSRSAMPCAR